MKITKDKNNIWRSQLYVPANNSKFIKKAHMRGSDAIILDLEDSLTERKKKSVLKNLTDIIPTVSQSGSDVLIRINSTKSFYEEELEYCIHPMIKAIIVPKLSKIKQINNVVKIVDKLEKDQKIKKNQIKLIGLIENSAGFFNAKKLSKSSIRLISLVLGVEDFSLNNRFIAKSEFLMFPKQFLLLICRNANLIPYGLLDSIADFSNLNKLKRIAKKSYEFGFEGSSCIHPSVVPVLNSAFTPTKEEKEEAKNIIEIFEEALSKNLSVVKYNNKMIDLPIYKRAQKLLEKVEYFNKK